MCQRVRIPCVHRSGPSRRMDEHRGRAEHYRQSALVLFGPAWPVDCGGHGVFVVAGGCASRVSKPAYGRLRAGHRRRSEPAAVSGDLSGLRSSRRIVDDGPVSRLRCGRGRVRAGRGLRGGGAQAIERCAARREPGAGGGAGFGAQSGWPIQRADGPESGRANGRVARGLRQRGRAATRGGLCRDAWNRNTFGRSHRGACAGYGVGSRTSRELTAADRRHQVESGSFGGGGRDRGFHQGGAGGAARPHSAEPGLRDPESTHPVRPDATESRCRSPGLAVGAASAAGGGVVVRLRWHECACGDRAGPGCWVRARAGRAGGDDVGGVGQDARAGGVAGRRCWPTGWRTPGPRWRWPISPTR